MTPHAEHLALRITALCPVHVGAGLDFEPTDYVIDAVWRWPNWRKPSRPRRSTSAPRQRKSGRPRHACRQ